MRNTIIVTATAFSLVACAGGKSAAADTTRPDSTPTATATVTIDWAQVDSALGRSGAVQPGDVHRYSMPRSDLKVTVDGVAIRPAFALGSWVAFKAHGSGSVAMGDLVLTDAELPAVIARLQQGGVEQTAVHHHIIRESPRVLYVHIHGHGNPVDIATTVRAALALTGTPPAAPAGAAAAAPQPLGIDSAAIASALGYPGRVTGGVLQFSVPRAEAIHSAGFEIPPSMGLATAINFQPTGSGKAAITGDFVLLGAEVNPVIKTLTENGISVTSLHSHLLDEEPRLFFMHFWANADAPTLARGLKAALARTNSRPSTP